jgi:hypothetical protein
VASHFCISKDFHRVTETQRRIAMLSGHDGYPKGAGTIDNVGADRSITVDEDGGKAENVSSLAL